MNKLNDEYRNYKFKQADITGRLIAYGIALFGLLWLLSEFVFS